MGGFAEIGEFGILEAHVFAGGKFFINAVRTNFVAHGDLALGSVEVLPAFVPNPNVSFVVEELAAMASRDRTKNGAAETRFGVNQLAGTEPRASRTRRATEEVSKR